MKKKFKFIGVIMALAMIMSLFAAGLSAEEGTTTSDFVESKYAESTVAIIEGYKYNNASDCSSGEGLVTEFDDLWDALNAASWLDGCTLTLVKDVIQDPLKPFTISGGEFTLDLNGFTIYGSPVEEPSAKARAAQSGYELNILDTTVTIKNGSFTNATGSGVYCENSTVIFDGVRIYDFNGNGAEAYGINSVNSNITFSNGSSIKTTNDVMTYGINAVGGSLNIDGSEIALTSDFPVAKESTAKNIYGVKVDNCALTAKNSEINIGSEGYALNSNQSVQYYHHAFYIENCEKADLNNVRAIVETGSLKNPVDENGNPLKDESSGNLWTYGWNFDALTIYNDKSNLTATDCTINAQTSGEDANAHAVFNTGEGNVTLDNCTVSAKAQGTSHGSDVDAIFNMGGSVEVNNCSIDAWADSTYANGIGCHNIPIPDKNPPEEIPVENTVTINGGSITVYSKHNASTGVMLKSSKNNLTVDGCDITATKDVLEEELDKRFAASGIWCLSGENNIDFINGKITTDSIAGWDAAFSFQTPGKLNIQGGEINSWIGLLDLSGNVVTTMTGGTINAEDTAITCLGGSKLDISNGKISSKNGVVGVNAEITMTDGTISTDVKNGDYTFQQNGSTTIKISGGTFPLGFKGGKYNETDKKLDDVSMSTVASDWLVSPKVFLDQNGLPIDITADMTDIAQYTYVGVYDENAHNITVNVKGKGEATANVTTAKAGDIVTITCKAQSGYHFVSVKADDKTVVLTKTASGVYEFTMPDKDVVITATFAANSTGGGGNGGDDGYVDVEIPTDGQKPDPDDVIIVDKDGGNKYPDIEVDDDGTIIIPDLKPGDKVIIEDKDGNDHVVIVPDDNGDKDHNSNPGDVETDKVHLGGGKNPEFEVINPPTFDDTPILVIYGSLVMAFVAGLYLTAVFKKKTSEK